MVEIKNTVSPGDFVKVYMDVCGMIDDCSDHAREFEVIALCRRHNNYYEVLVSYGKEKLYSSFVLTEDVFKCNDDYIILKKHPNTSKYIGNQVRWLNDDRIAVLISCGPDGCFCEVCKEFYNYAVANQDNGTLICWACRQNPMRAYY